jgi:hypothetical protein
MTTKVLVCGGRDYNDFDRLEDELNRIERAYGVITIISGCARGADSLAIKYAETYGDDVLKFPADWDKHGRAAGPIRNQQMLDEGKPDLVIAFPGGKGTMDMINRSKKANIEVIEIVN